MARVVVARSARLALLGLSDRFQGAILDALDALEADPEMGHTLRGRLQGLRSLRVGSYRVIYELREGGRLVRVCAIRHRAAAYKTDPR
jgi:mRNA interferase RelE/StbE